MTGLPLVYETVNDVNVSMVRPKLLHEGRGQNEACGLTQQTVREVVHPRGGGRDHQLPVGRVARVDVTVVSWAGNLGNAWQHYTLTLPHKWAMV